MSAKEINKWIMATLAVWGVLLLCGFVPYTPDANTVLLDHFDGATSASVLAYRETGAACGSAKPSATPSSAYVQGTDGLSQALVLTPPVGEPAGSATYLQYPGGQLLSQPNGTIEFWIYLAAYGTAGVSLIEQGPYPGSCAGWTFGLIVSSTGQLQSSSWAAFSMDSGMNTVPLHAWTHVAASWGGDGAKLYINGVQVGSSANTGMPASGYGGSVLVNQGRGVSLQIDELRISNVQRTSFSSGGAGMGTHHASGTYTWNAATGVMAFNWTSTDFTCDGPSSGTETKTGVIITSTTMTWANDNLTWTRPSGTAGDIVGTWTSTDSATGNSYTLTYDAGGTVSVTGITVSCGGGDEGNRVKAEAQHFPDYSVLLRYIDHEKTASLVSVTGPGITDPMVLTYVTGRGSWESGPASPGSPLFFGAAYPDGLPFTYTFTITDGTGTWTADSTISCFQQQFVENISPTGPVTGTPTFSWTGINDPGARYGVEVDDDNGNPVWSQYFIYGTSIVYDGPALTPGMTYGYVVSLQSSSACSNPTSGGGSGVWGSFTYGGGGTITVSGIARDWSGNIIPAPGVTVTLVGDETKTTTSSTADGSFSLHGVPANTAFSLKFNRAGYLDVYTPTVSATGDINMNVSATGSSPFNMPTEADLTALGALPESGKGLISGRVADSTYRYSSTVGGVFLTATGGSKSYPVYYRDSFGNLYPGGTTSGNGRYYVLNVDDGDTVILSASKAGWSFSLRTFGTHAAGVSEARIIGTAPGYSTMSGSVINTAAAPIAGARLELNGDNGKFVVAGGNGSYSFEGLPRDANFYIKTTAAGYVSHYASVNLPANLSGIGITLWTTADMTGAGATGSNGVIACRVTDTSLNPLSGATVTLQSKSGTVYTPSYPGGSGATAAAGIVLVPNILPGDVVKVSVAKAGYAFATVSLDGFSGAVTGRIIAGGTPVAYNSYISDKDTVGIAGVTVEQVGAANTTTSSASPAGAYTLNVPYGVPFYLRSSKTGFADTYSAEMTRTAPLNESLADGLTLQAATRLADWHVASGKGIIRARVKDGAGNPIAGAAVFYTSGQGRTYTICYDDACTPGLATTQEGSGRYIVRDVEPGDTVTVTARKSGYTFNTRVFHTYAGSVHQGGITGTAASNSNSVFGTVSYGGSQTGSSRLVLWSADMMGNYNRELTITGGSFTFDGVPNGRYFLSAYRDRDGNGQYTAGEAYGFYQDAGGLLIITVDGAGVNIGAVTLADPSAGPTGASVSINSAIGGVRGYLIFFRSGVALTSNLQNGTNPSFTLDVDLTAGSHDYAATQMKHDFTGMPVPAGIYDFYFMTGDLEDGPDKGVIQYVQTGVVIAKGAVTNISASGAVPFNAGGAVSGTVTSSFGGHHSLGRVTVYLTGDPAGQILKAWGATDANGQFRFDHVPAGTYYLQLMYAGYDSFPPMTVTVTEGQTLIIPGSGTVLTPSQTPATISGTLNPFGPGVDSRVLLKLGDTVIAGAATDTANGSYAISDVVPGGYALVGSARGFAPIQVPVNVTAGQALIQNFNLNSTKNVLVNGLNWLLAHQRADGSFDDNLAGDADPFVFGWTGYAGLTLLAVLENPKYNVSASPDYLGTTLLGQIHDALYGIVGATSKNGIKQYFESTYHATDDASTGWSDIGAFYNSPVAWSSVAATPVALEKLIALGMPLNDPRITGAVQFLLGAQVTAARAINPIFAGGWRYNPGNTDTDNWETAWVIMALMKAGVNPTVQAVVDGLAHIRRSQVTGGGGAGLFAYQPNDTSGYGPLGTSAACILALNFAGVPNSDPDVDRFFQWVKNNGGFNGYDRWADAYWWSMFPWAAILYDDPATSAPVKKYYETLELTWNMADDVISRQNPDGSWSNPNYIPGGSNSGNAVMYTASALMAIAPYAGLTPLPDETTIAGTVRNPSGAGLQDAKVEALLDGVVRASTVTSGSGAYTLSVPQNYAYTLRVTAAGYVRKAITTADVGGGGLTGQDIAYLTSDEDAAAPAITGLVPVNGSTVLEIRPFISAGLTDLGSGGNAPAGIDPATISMKLDGNAVSANYNDTAGTLSFTPQYDLSAATHAVTVDVRDFAGNAAVQASWSFAIQGISFTPMVYSVHAGDGNYYTYLEVPIGAEFAGTLPDAITALNVTGPVGGVIATLSDFVYYSAWREFLAKLPGMPAVGQYSFEMSSPLAPTTIKTDSYLTVRNIPVPNKARFSYSYAAGEGVTFTWAAVTVEGLTPYYRLIIEDMAGNRVYDSGDVQGMLSHAVPDGTLLPNQLYRFHVRVVDAQNGGAVQNESRSEYLTFRLNPVSYTGYILDSQSPSQVIAGATVEQGGVPANFATTDAAGLYTLGNLKAGLPFYMKMYRDVSYAPSYSAEMTYTADRVDARDRAFNLFPATRLGPGTGNWNVDSDKGIIRTHVRDKIDGYIGGAIVTAAGVLQQTYAVCYDDDCTPSLTATRDASQSGAGRFVVKNVLDGDTVTVTATKAGWTFNTRVYHTFAGGVSQGRITGQGPVSLAVTAVNPSGGSAIQGAQLQAVGFPDVSATTGANGSATLTGLPPNTTIPFGLGKTGYVNSYGQFSASSGVSTWRVPLFTQAALWTWGVQAGKGVIYGRLMDNANPDDNTNSVTGVQVQYTGAQGRSYDVVYLNNDWTVAPGATATLSSGRYLILNVNPTDTVTVSARKTGWSFWSTKVQGYAGGVSYGYVRGIAGGATVAMYVKDKNNMAMTGATVRVAENTTLAATSDSGGKVTLTNLPLDTPLTFEVISSGYRNTYSRNVILTGNNSDWGTYYLYAADDSVSLGGIAADRGVIHGWVKNDVDGGNLAGAQVTCSSGLGNTYTVVYLNNDHTIAAGATATSSNGRFAILDVAPGDTVTATAHLAGWTFEPRTYTARANAVNQSSIYGVVEILKGDLDGNHVVNLADAIIAARVLSGWATTIRDDYAASGADMDNDGKVGAAEMIFILQKLGEMR